MTKHTKIFANETEYKNYISSAAYQTPVISVMNDKRYMGYDNRKEEIIATTTSNSRLITIAQQKGWIPSTQTYLTKHECEAVTSIDLSNSNIQMFDEFRYFTRITTIEENAFEYSDLISITLPNTITEIKFDAFYSCYNLKNIILPNSLKIIGVSAFEDCQSLQSIIIPNNVTTIGASAFYNCGLTHIEIPETVKQLNNCFVGCEHLTSVKLHEGLEILTNTFNSCLNLLSIDIPSTVKMLGNTTFYQCRKLSKITFNGNALSVIGSNCFSGCWNLHELKIPESVVEIGSRAFYDSPIKSINIPHNVTTLSDYLFWGDAELTTLEIPEGVTTIGNYTFSHVGEQWPGNDFYAHNPLRLTIPRNVTNIGSYCFSGLISELKFETVSAPTITAATFSDLNLNFTKILIKRGTHSLYRNAAYWSNIISYIQVY